MKKTIFILSYLICVICFAQNPPNSVYYNDYGLTAHSYIQDGLVNMWDAKENIGWGLHSDTTTVWKDLIGNRDITLSGTYNWSNNAWNVFSSDNTSNSGLGTWPASNLPSNQTWQITIDPDAISENGFGRIIGASNYRVAMPMIISSPSSLYFIGYSHYNSKAVLGYYNSYEPHQHTIAHTADSEKFSYYIDGQIKWWYSANASSSTVDSNSTGQATAYFANNVSKNRGLDAKYYCMRLYDRHLTDKEIIWNYMIDSIRYNLPRQWYPYANEAWAWEDYTDEYVLWTDNQYTNHPAKGESVNFNSNKGKYNSSVAALVGVNRSENEGICSAVFTNGNGASTAIRTGSYLFTTNSDWYNLEFASLFVAKNQRGTPTGSAYLFYGDGWGPLLWFYNTVADLRYRTMTTNSTSLKMLVNGGGIDRRKFGTDPQMYSVRTKVVNGEFETKFSINGCIITNVTGTVPPNFERNYRFGLNWSSTRNVLGCDYCEFLVWNKIPEDWDLIEKTLMLKYNIKPFTYYYPNFGKPLLGGGFGGVFIGGDSEEPELDEPLDEEIEESE